MKTIFYTLLFLLAHVSGFSATLVGLGKSSITPKIGTPSAGYADRKGEGMDGVHDLLLATSLYIETEQKKVVFCAVDHLGYTYEMVQKIVEKIHLNKDFQDVEIFIGSSHTHSGGGAFLNIPKLGQYLAGSYDPEIEAFYIDQTTDAILHSLKNTVPAKIGIGYTLTDEISFFRSSWPILAKPLYNLTIFKITTEDDLPLAVLFNFPMHPTTLSGKNRLFSSDFVGYARDHIRNLIDKNIEVLYFNGAQGDINPKIAYELDPFKSCDFLGSSLAKTVEKVWKETETSNDLEITTFKNTYSFTPEPTPFGLCLPLSEYNTEINLVVLNQKHAFITIPGELSSLYDSALKSQAKNFGFEALSILGLTNDAHGYIILPEAWEHKTMESSLSFGGKEYGPKTLERANLLFQTATSTKSAP